MLVAVIVPNPETLNRWAKDVGFTKPFEELCSLPELQEHIVSELKSTAEKNKVCLLCLKSNFFKILFLNICLQELFVNVTKNS